MRMKHMRSFNRHSVAGIIAPPIPGVETPGYPRLPLCGNIGAFFAAERLVDVTWHGSPIGLRPYPPLHAKRAAAKSWV